MKNAKFLVWKMHVWAKKSSNFDKILENKLSKISFKFAKNWRVRSREECKSCRMISKNAAKCVFARYRSCRYRGERANSFCKSLIRIVKTYWLGLEARAALAAPEPPAAALGPRDVEGDEPEEEDEGQAFENPPAEARLLHLGPKKMTPDPPYRIFN